MVVGVKVFVNGGAFEAEVSAEIDHLTAQLKKRNGELSGEAVREGQKDDLRLFGQQFGFGFAEAELFSARMVGEFGKDMGKALAGVLAGGERSQFHKRMRK